MKITKENLQQIIKEELSEMLGEEVGDFNQLVANYFEAARALAVARRNLITGGRRELPGNIRQLLFQSSSPEESLFKAHAELKKLISKK